MEENPGSKSSEALVTAATVALLAFLFIITYMAVHYCIVYFRRPNPPRLDTWAVDPAERGVDPAMLMTCPIFTYSEVSSLRHDTGPLECAVCLGAFEEDEMLRLLPTCDHVFHLDCVDRWLAGHSTCPLCRAKLELKPGESNRVGTGRVDGLECGEVVEGNDVVEERREIHIQLQFGKYKRWNSAGHVASVGGLENRERYTLKLPEDVRNQFLQDKFYRSRSCILLISR